MSTHPFLKTLRLKNLLSFGPEGTQIDLLPLNILIGPNGSGKSNLIESIGLLRACAVESGLSQTISAGGGITEWLWKSEPDRDAEIESVVNIGRSIPLHHRIVLGSRAERTTVIDEAIEDEIPSAGSRKGIEEEGIHYRFNQGSPIIRKQGILAKTARRVYQASMHVELRADEVRPNESILVQRRDPGNYPELAALTDKYSRIQIFRGFETTRFAAIRSPQRSDSLPDKLEADGLNLGVVLSNIKHSGMRDEIHRRLKRFRDCYEEIDVRVFGGRVQIYLHERDVGPISAYQMPDGLLRYLCMLAVLCNPVCPLLVCIEEPEIGVHPDMILEITDLLVEASKRTQIVVATHSDMIVDRFTDAPENIVVFEKEGASSTMKRLDRKELKAWLKKYRLGQLWAMGHLGGSRW